MLREWTAYSGSRDHVLGTALQPVSFKESIAKARQLPYEYDLVIHPGAGTDNRKWPAGYFARLIGDLPAEYRVAVVGLPQDIAALRAVLPAGRAITFLSGSLEEAIVSIARSRVALTMDSGSMFFASLLHVPTVTLFGPSNPANVMIPGPNFTPIYEEKWSCQPCRRPKCSQRQVYCMAAINPATVLDAIIRLRRSAP
jgi:heptosyltransferase-2